jgi:hypothetical protein
LRTNFHPSTRSSRMAWAMQAGAAPSAPSSLPGTSAPIPPIPVPTLPAPSVPAPSPHPTVR